MNREYSLDSLIEYRIEVAGLLGEHRPEWLDENIISTLSDSEDTNITVLTGKFDQAGLLGLLRRLYYLGIPLVSVNHIGS